MSLGSEFVERVRARLAALKSAGLVRQRLPPSGIDLSSNDYLNLSTHPEVVRRFAEGVQREGCGSTGSRLLRGERTIFNDLEQRFSLFKQSERALFFSSGYLANIATLAAFAERGDVVLSDSANHASLIDGIRLSRARTVVFPHNDIGRLRDLLSDETLNAESGSARFVVVESLFSMDGDEAPLADLVDVCRSCDATLIVDEAHAVGVFGESGSGLLEASGIAGNACLSINPAGKALGAAGAFVAGPAWAIDYLAQRARPFVFSTAPLPALADAIDASLDIVEGEPARRARLLANAAYLRGALARAGVAVPPGSSQIVPVIVGDNDRAVVAAERLRAEGLDIRAIRPPSVPPGTARLRLSVNAGLSESVLDRVAERMASVLREVGVCSVGSS
jgi:8-amino-7-oxononanoate synthase